MIDKNSRGTLVVVVLSSLLVATLVLLFVHIPWIVWPAIFLLLWFVVWQFFFFNVPTRQRTGDSTHVSSVADGRVVIVKKAFEKEYLKRDCIQVSVYMNFFDVHANFWPIDGTVTYYKYYPGKHFFAATPKASEENEHSCVGVTTSEGKQLFFKQIAGGFARRIVCYAAKKTEAIAGHQCGIIKFGSRIDLFLPLDAKILVKVGDLVRASESLIAEL